MPTAQGQTIKYTEDDEHVLRRLGGAVIVHWEALSTAMQELLIQQAADMTDRHPMPSGDLQIREFIDAHKGGD
jgi:hypothetical protein